MIQIVYSPQWFYGHDIIIDIVSIIVLMLVGIFALRYYKIRENSNDLYLALSFFTVAASFVFKILTNFTIYYNDLVTKRLGAITLTYNTVEPSNLLFIIGFLLYHILMILGFYLLYIIYQPQEKTNHILFIYLIIALTYFSRSAYYVFHLLMFLLLAIITYIYYTKHMRKDSKATKMLASSFLIITISHALFIPITISTKFYVAGEFVQLFGYLILLLTFIKVLKHGRKKNED